MAEREAARAGDPTTVTAPRRRWLVAGRVLFLASAAGFAAWGLRGHWDELLAALVAVSPVQAALATGAITIGLLATAVAWRLLLARIGYPLDRPAAGSVFFVGQLGKYIPGSVWWLAAQVQLAGRYRVPGRATSAAGALFLATNLCTATAYGGLVAAATGTPRFLPPWGWLAVAGIGLVGLSPWSMRTLGRWVYGSGEPALGWRESLHLCVLLAGVWTLYGVGLVLLVPSTATAPGPVAAAGCYAVAYVVGLVVVFSPAGLGAREAVLVLLLTPTLGLPAATVAALLVRVVHTTCDFVLAAVAWAAHRAALARATRLA